MEENLRKMLEDRLVRADRAAVDNVRAGRGGPFAASLHVYHRDRAEMTDIAEPAGNSVLATGLASAHAEDRAIQPDHVAALKKILHDTGAEAAHVYLVTSGESCPACHAKLEILARTLLHEKLILPGRFTVIYGATYEDTHQVAGFNDAPYHDDFQKPAGTGLIRQKIVKYHDLPPMIRDRVKDVAAPVAVIATKDRILAGTGDFPEISAIHFASAMQLRARIEDPWNLRMATLYSFTRDIGPMAYAECQWANVTQWVTIDHPDAKLFATREAPDIDNKALFDIIRTRPYTHPQAALQMLHFTPFANEGQQEWARQTGLRRYNGA